MCFDDVTNLKRKNLVALDAIGNIYLYNINQVRRRYASDLPTSRLQTNEWKLDLRVVYSKKLLPNPKYILVADIRN